MTGSGHPTCGFVYKLVAREGEDGALVSVAKRSPDKASVGGRKFALRRRDRHGIAEAEVVGIGTPPVDDGDDRDRCWCRWCATARSSAGSRSTAARERHPRPAPSCRSRPSR